MRVTLLLAAMLIAVAFLPFRTKFAMAGGGTSSSSSAIQQAAATRLDAAPVPLSAMARLGQKMFFDPSLSGSGRMSCASCHDPRHAYAPGNALPAQMGGSDLRLQGIRAVPTLTYLERTPRFAIRPDSTLDPEERGPGKAARPRADPSLDPMNFGSVVPEGGMDWDGRAAVLADQAGGPLLDPREMANKDGAELLAKLKSTAYAGEVIAVFGPQAFSTPSAGLADMYLALARFQMEDRSFHAYNSKFDYYLAGRVKLTEEELRGLAAFDDPHKGNCAACHLDKPSKNRFAPVFTDYEFEALAVPRNPHLSANRDAKFFDEGLCGPLRKDLAKPDYCGLFKTPTLRNVATRQVFFHNGGMHSLEETVRFYVERETRPEKWYPRRADGKIARYDDLPEAYRANVDTKDAPFNRRRGATPALSEREIQEVVAFLKTLTDNYQPTPASSAARK